MLVLKVLNLRTGSVSRYGRMSSILESMQLTSGQKAAHPQEPAEPEANKDSKMQQHDIDMLFEEPEQHQEQEQEAEEARSESEDSDATLQQQHAELQQHQEQEQEAEEARSKGGETMQREEEPGERGEAESRGAEHSESQETECKDNPLSFPIDWAGRLDNYVPPEYPEHRFWVADEQLSSHIGKHYLPALMGSGNGLPEWTCGLLSAPTLPLPVVLSIPLFAKLAFYVVKLGALNGELNSASADQIHALSTELARFGEVLGSVCADIRKHGNLLAEPQRQNFGDFVDRLFESEEERQVQWTKNASVFADTLLQASVSKMREYVREDTLIPAINAFVQQDFQSEDADHHAAFLKQLHTGTNSNNARMLRKE